MKNLKGKFIVCVLAVVFVFLILQSSLQANQNVNQDVKVNVNQEVKVLLPPADIRLTMIETHGCVCEDSLNSVDALLIKDGIKVYFYNAGPGTTDVKVEVTFYDYKLCKLRTIVPRKLILMVKPNTTRYVFLKGPYLVKKSMKIKAYAYPVPELLANGKKVDQYPRNNRKEIGKCRHPIQ